MYVMDGLMSRLILKLMVFASALRSSLSEATSLTPNVNHPLSRAESSFCCTHLVERFSRKATNWKGVQLASCGFKYSKECVVSLGALTLIWSDA